MQEPDSEHQIETVIDGERVCGTVHHSGSSDISVRLDHPSNDWLIGRHMPYFARGVYPEGFLGDYGEQRALELLVSLYKQQKRGDRRRKFAGFDFEEFGRVRYLAVDPGHPRYGRKIREQASIEASVYVQLEDDIPYGLARFFDSGTKQPFLAESAVYDESIQEYVNGVKADLGFSRHLETTRRKLLSTMVRYATLLKSYRVNPHQGNLLENFGRAWREGDMRLDAPEIDQLIDLGYLVRDPESGATERVAMESSLDRCRKAMERFDAAGRPKQAAECFAKIHKLKRRIDAKTLMITTAGKAVARNFSVKVER